MSFVLDTNVLIYGLENSRKSAVDLLLNAPVAGSAISVVTWMEMLVGAVDTNRTRKFLHQFELIQLNQNVMERAVEVRRRMRLKLPDAIIYASALTTGRALVTYNTRDFPPGTPSVLNPDASADAMR